MAESRSSRKSAPPPSPVNGKTWRHPAVWAAAAVLLATSGSCFLSPLGMVLPNLGLPFGYYGELNRTKQHIQAIDGVIILDVRANYDLTIEEFTVAVLIDGTHRSNISVPDASLASRLEAVEAWRLNELPKLRQP